MSSAPDTSRLTKHCIMLPLPSSVSIKLQLSVVRSFRVMREPWNFHPWLGLGEQVLEPLTCNSVV
uniref:Uncharacterized protein n=1 Tax=Arundo donax TaxID=35708 RepID=A0A0A9A7W0_ARUDO